MRSHHFGKLGAGLRDVLCRWRERHKAPCDQCRDVDAMFSGYVNGTIACIERCGTLYLESLQQMIIPQHMRCPNCRRGPIDVTKQADDFISRVLFTMASREMMLSPTQQEERRRNDITP